MFRHVVFSPAYQHPSLCYSTSSPTCSSFRMTRMSGQSCVWEQGSGVKGSGGSSATAGVSFRTGKKVSRSQSCPPSSSSSLASAPTSHRILDSVAKETHFPTELTSNTHSLVKRKISRACFYLCHLLYYFCYPQTCQSLNPNTAIPAPVVTSGTVNISISYYTKLDTVPTILH